MSWSISMWCSLPFAWRNPVFNWLALEERCLVRDTTEYLCHIDHLGKTFYIPYVNNETTVAYRPGKVDPVTHQVIWSGGISHGGICTSSLPMLLPIRGKKAGHRCLADKTFSLVLVTAQACYTSWPSHISRCSYPSTILGTGQDNQDRTDGMFHNDLYPGVNF